MDFSAKFQKILKQLKQSGISKGVWIDAGCGKGTYTFPLAMLASQVIAIDNNPYDISFLKSQLPQKTNVIVSKKDFTKDLLFPDLVDGVLFGFSLHYKPSPTKALQNAFNHLKSNGRIIIFEYTRDKPVPWVPFPIPKWNLIPLLEKAGFQEIDTIINNTRFYIIGGKKISP
ncbi:MAG: class I SAM-dependent methyltransferase [Candidatus Hodarchaeales archaeon]|jgi:SAM-dependent methyltransferase